MYKYLTVEHSISIISEEEMIEFKSFAKQHSYIAVLIGNEELDLFTWRIALDVYHMVGSPNDTIIFAPDRAMISPLQFFLLNSFLSSEEFKRLAYTKGHSKYEKFLVSIYIAVCIKRWAFSMMNGEGDQIKQLFLYGDLFGFIHSARISIEELPSALLNIQAEVMQKLKKLMNNENIFVEIIKEAIFESKNLSTYLDLSVEECLQWKIRQ